VRSQLHGIPGSGKTVLCSTAISYVEELCQPGTVRMAYYYFDFSEETKQKLTALLRSLLFQLCEKMDTIPEDLSVLYDECDRGRSNPSEQSLAENLFRVLDSDQQTYVMIDGLDECPYGSKNSERRKLNDMVLGQIGQRPGNYNFFITSRKEHDIEEAMKALVHRTDLHDIEIQTEDVDSDVRLHINRFMAGHNRISRWSASIRREIEDELVKGSQGM